MLKYEKFYRNRLKIYYNIVFILCWGCPCLFILTYLMMNFLPFVGCLG
ncbi:hypothetical protein AO373_0001 [Moraxella catarrhalis]|nr:hypothetical protein AO373_0001 [Moraxella catarrhalis]